MSGRYRLSHMPYKLFVHVPPTTKSSVITGAPIKSNAEMKGFLSAFNPATMGSTKYGPNLICGGTRWTRMVSNRCTRCLLSLRTTLDRLGFWHACQGHAKESPRDLLQRAAVKVAHEGEGLEADHA